MRNLIAIVVLGLVACGGEEPTCYPQAQAQDGGEVCVTEGTSSFCTVDFDPALAGFPPPELCNGGVPVQVYEVREGGLKVGASCRPDPAADCY